MTKQELDSKLDKLAKEDRAKVLELLAKLEALMDEYDASIWGCGCCGSPSLNVGKHFTWDNFTC